MLKNLSKNKKVIAITLIIGAFCLLTYGFTFARYVASSMFDYNLRSKGFYFYSDNLDIIPKDNTNSRWSGGSVTFNLKNFQNESVITEFDINYIATCEVTGDAATYAECKLNDTATNIENGTISAHQYCLNETNDAVDVNAYDKTACELGGYSWERQAVNKNMYFDVILTDNTKTLESVTVNVNVRTTTPYEKEISGNFILNKVNEATLDTTEIVHSYEDLGDFGRLTVTNRTSNIEYIALGWSDTKFLLDRNDLNLESYTTTQTGYYNRATIAVPRSDSKSLIFFKKNPADTTSIADFTIGKGIQSFLDSYVAGVYKEDETNLYVGGVSWQNDKLMLNGLNQGIEIYDNNADYSAGITMVIYFNRTSGSGIQNLIMKRSTNMNGYFMFLNGNQLNIDVGGANARVISNIQIQNGVDYHLIYTWDPVAKGKLYLNGVLYSSHTSGNGTTLNQAGNTPIKVGFDKDGVYGGQKYPFKGEIMAMNIYNDALTSEEVWDIYQRDYSLR